VCLASAQNNRPKISSDLTGNIKVEVPSGGTLQVKRGSVTAEVVTAPTLSNRISQLQSTQSSSMDAMMSMQADSMSTIQSLQSTISSMTARISTLEAVTPAPVRPPTTRSPTNPPTSSPVTRAPTAPPVTSSPTNPPTADLSNCPDGPNGDNTGCARWRPATAAMLKDVDSHYCAVTIQTAHGFSVRSVANARGCGQSNLGSSMGFYLTGPWTKIRYTMTIAGRTSCYSLFGSDGYNYHAHTDNTDPWTNDARTSVSFTNQLGAEGGGLYELNISAGDTIQQTGFPCPGSAWTCSQACTNVRHPWYLATSNLRQMTVTLRRRFNVFENGVKQYAELAGPAVGVSCVATGSTSWNISNVQLLW